MCVEFEEASADPSSTYCVTSDTSGVVIESPVNQTSMSLSACLQQAQLELDGDITNL